MGDPIDISFGRISPICRSRARSIDIDISELSHAPVIFDRTPRRMATESSSNKLRSEIINSQQFRRQKTFGSNSGSKTLAGFLNSIGFSPQAKIDQKNEILADNNAGLIVKNDIPITGAVSEKALSKVQSSTSKKSSLKIKTTTPQSARNSTAKIIALISQKKPNLITPSKNQGFAQFFKADLYKSEEFTTAQDLIARTSKRTVSDFDKKLKKVTSGETTKNTGSSSKSKLNKGKHSKLGLQRRLSINLDKVVSQYQISPQVNEIKLNNQFFSEVSSLRRMNTICASTLSSIYHPKSKTVFSSQGSQKDSNFGRSINGLFKKTVVDY